MSSANKGGAAKRRECKACGHVATWGQDESMPLACPACGHDYLLSVGAEKPSTPSPSRVTTTTVAPRRSRRPLLIGVGVLALLATAGAGWMALPASDAAAMALCKASLNTELTKLGYRDIVLPDIVEMNDGDDAVFAWTHSTSFITAIDALGQRQDRIYTYCLVDRGARKVVELDINDQHIIAR